MDGARGGGFQKAKIDWVVKIGTGQAKKYKYGRRHLQAEKGLKDHGLALTVLRGGELFDQLGMAGPLYSHDARSQLRRFRRSQ